MNIITDYFRTLLSVLFRPQRFFETLPTVGGLSEPLVFALVTGWVGVGAAHIVQGLTFGPIDPTFQIAASAWVLLDPFFRLVSILFGSMITFWVSGLLIPPELRGARPQVTYESALRIVCYASSPSIFSIIPGAGPIISGLYGFILLLMGLRFVYRIDPFRAFWIGFIPVILPLGLLFFVVLLLLVSILPVIGLTSMITS